MHISPADSGLPYDPNTGQRVPSDWQGAITPYPRDRTVHGLYREQVARRPNAVAVQDGDTSLTYAELDKRTNRLAHHLRDLGVGREDAVAVCMDRSLEFVTAVLAILKAGGTYVPFSPDLPPKRIESIFDDIAPRLVITHGDRFAPPYADACAVLHIDSDAAAFETCPTAPLEESATPTDVACILFTSGSTGRPKGVQMVHRGIVQLLFGTDYVPFDEEDVFLLLASVSFDASLLELWGPLLHGARCVIYSDDELDFGRLGAVVREAGVSCMWLTSTLFNSLIDLDPGLLQGVSYLLTGGEALSVPHVCKALKALPSTTIMNGYGPAETTVFTTTFAVPRDFPADARSVPVGRPIANTRAYVLDPDMNPVAVGEPGELYVGKENLARGYCNRPDLTKERFLPDPFLDEPGARVYKSGDRCRWLPDGTIEFLGRFDSQVKVRGFRIELAEIEWVLGQHPDVLQSAACTYGESNARRIAAFVKRANDAACTEEDLRSHIADYLPDYMVPSTFVLLDAFPLTPSGKVDRQALPPMAAEAAAEVTVDVLPETDTEQTLADIWGHVFGIDRVGAESNFFDLGGDSLKAAGILARISRALGVDLKHRHLFDMPTIRALARHIDGLSRSEDAVNRIERCEGATSAPLSFEQEEIWAALQVHTDEPIFNEPFTLRIAAPVDPDAMSRALDALAARHEAFRTAITVKDGAPSQVIADSVAIPFRTIDLRDLPREERETQGSEAATTETRLPFRLDKAPLLRALLVRVADDDHQLHLIMHHMITDAWTFYNVMVPDLRAIYDAFVNGEEPSLGAPPIQYADYARWQRKRLQGPAVEERLAIWRDRFDGAQAVSLTPDRLARRGHWSRGESRYASIPPDLTRSLRELAHNENATLFTVLLSGFSTLLARYTQQEDIVVGTAVDCRSVPELEAAAGCFVRAVPVRSNLAGGPAFRELVQRTRDTLLETHDIKDVPFAALMDALHVPGGPTRQELLSITCVMEPGVPTPPSDWEGWQVEIQTGTAKFDLLFEFEERHDGIIVRIEHRTGLFDTATVDRMNEHLVCLLQAAVAEPECPVSRLPLAPEEDLRDLVNAFAGSRRPYPRNESVHSVFARQAAKRPDAIAVTDGETTLPYRDLDRRANQFAHYLQARGVSQGSSVAVCMDRSWEFVVAVLGILKTGAVYAPFDPGLPARRVEYLLGDVGAALLVTHRDCCVDIDMPGLSTVVFDDVSADVAKQPETDPGVLGDADDIAYIMYTSGSTGEPKGVEVTHRGIVRLVCGNDYVPFDETMTTLLLAPIGFDATTFELWGALLNGGRCAIYPEREVGIDSLQRVLDESHVTCLWLTAALFDTVIDARPSLLSGVPYVLTGGEALSVPHVRRALESLPNTHLINGYGPTENTTFSCTYRVPARVSDHAVSIPIGRPIANTRAHILDANQQPVPVGVPGELYVGGDGVARGYRSQPELTAERFMHDPFAEEPGARMYRTGDRCRWLPDGTIEFLGRFDDQVKIRGFRIELGEVEAVLSRHPNVAQCAVAVRGTGDARSLVAYVQLTADAGGRAEGLRAFLAERLPGHMVPAVFEVLEAIPLTPNGKVDRDALPDPVKSHQEYVPPRTDTERALTEIWKEALDVERVGVTDDFFSLGGHSLKAVSIAAAIERRFGRSLTLTHFFTEPTIAQLAHVLDNVGDRDTSGKAVRLAGAGTAYPLFCIPGAGGTVFSFKRVAAQIGFARPVYGLQYPGLGYGETPMDSIGAVADELVKRILAAEPMGPFHLLGYSLGGYVAFEIGRRLVAAGHRVASLSMVDCVAPSALAKRPIVERIGIHLAHWRQKGVRAGMRYIAGKARHRFLERDQAHPFVPEEESGLTAENLRHLQRHMERAAMAYTPGTYPGRIWLFKAVEPEWYEFTVMDRVMGWGPHVEGGIEVDSVSGSHLDVFNEPHVGVLTSALERRLAEADID